MEKSTVEFNKDTMLKLVKGSWDLLVTEPNSAKTLFCSNMAFFYDTNIKSYSSQEACLEVLFETFVQGKGDKEEIYLSFQ